MKYFTAIYSPIFKGEMYTTIEVNIGGTESLIFFLSTLSESFFKVNFFRDGVFFRPTIKERNRIVRSFELNVFNQILAASARKSMQKKERGWDGKVS